MRNILLLFALIFFKYNSIYGNTYLCNVFKYENSMQVKAERKKRELERKYVITLKEKEVLSYSYLPQQEEEPFKYSYLILKEGMFGTSAINVTLQDIISIDSLSYFLDMSEGTHVLQFPTYVETRHFKCEQKN